MRCRGTNSGQARTPRLSPSPRSWLEDGQLLRDAGRLRDIPGTIIHGRYDMPCPARIAYALHKAWPAAAFHMIEGAGHAYTEPGILDRLIRATDRFAASG